jgi:hypothetical protein
VNRIYDCSARGEPSKARLFYGSERHVIRRSRDVVNRRVCEKIADHALSFYISGKMITTWRREAKSILTPGVHEANQTIETV